MRLALDGDYPTSPPKGRHQYGCTLSQIQTNFTQLQIYMPLLLPVICLPHYSSVQMVSRLHVNSEERCLLSGMLISALPS